MARHKITPQFITKNCPTCKLDFNINWLLRNRRTFCSKKCASNNPNIIKKNIEGQLKTFNEKYGGHPMITNPQTKINLEHSLFEKYGVKHYSQHKDWNSKIQSTKLKLYGDKNYINWNKIKSTILSKYGVDNPLKNKDIRIKVKNTNKTKYFNRIRTILINNKINPLFSIDNIINRHWNEKYRFQCLKCDYIFENSLYKVPTSIYCEKCDPDKKKTLENEIFDFLASLQPPLLVNRRDRTILNGKELDFYIPSKKIAIEFNGLYYHSELGSNKHKRYHLNKTNGCIFHKIQLIHIFENEWRDNKEIVKSELKRMLKIPNTTIIESSTCIIKKVNNKDAGDFLNKNHLCGEDKSSIKLGLYNNNELISIMTFIKSRFNKNTEWEILKHCDILNTVIKENSKKILLNYFIDNYKPTSIVGYSNKRFIDDNIYLNLGFTFIKNIPPDFNYISPDYKCLYNKMFFKGNKNLKNKLLKYDPLLSEWENMKLNGYDRIWNCGKSVWIWKDKPKLL